MKSEDPRKVTTPKVVSLYTNVNGLDDLLEDLDNYENYTGHENFYNSLDGGRMIKEPHVPFEDMEKIVVTKATPIDKVDVKNKGILENPSEIDYLLEHEEAYYKYLGING